MGGLKYVRKQGCLLYLLSFSIVLEVLATAIRQEKETEVSKLEGKKYLRQYLWQYYRTTELQYPKHCGTGPPWWLSGKEPACHHRKHGFDPWVRKIPCRRKWQPAPVLLPGKSHGQKEPCKLQSMGSRKSQTWHSDWTTITEVRWPFSFFI